VPRTTRLIGAVICTVAVVLQLPAAEPPSGREIHERLVPSCAWVVAGAEGRGTGWLVDAARKWLVTNYHVVGDSKSADVLFPVWRDGRLLAERDEYVTNMRQWRIEGKVLRRDPNRDLALIELTSVPATAKAVPLASQSASAGERVHILGNRRDLEQMWSYTSGRVRGVYRSEDGYPWRTRRLAQGCRLLALQAPINEGDSGGPAVNDRGELIGVTSAILWQAERTATAIDVTEVRAFLYPDTPPRPADPKRPDADAYGQLVRAVVLVHSPSSLSRSSGFVIDKSRRILLTTAQAAGPHERVELVFPKFEKGRVISEAAAYKDIARVKAGVIVRDTRRNLALLEAESLPAGTLEIAFAADSARPGDGLHSVGNPNGIDALWLYTALSVRQAGKIQLSSIKEDGQAGVLVLQGPGSANDGGGPIVDAKGRLVAVAGGKDGPEQQVNYAIELAEIRGFLEANRAKWDPKTADEFHGRGQRRMRIRQNDAALADFQEALRLVPTHTGALTDLPDLYRRRNESAKAWTAMQTALRQATPEQCAVPYAQRALLQMDRDKPDYALKDCDRALKIDPKCVRALVVRAEAWRRKKELAKAVADADEAIWLDANHGPAYFQRGLISMDQRDWDKALGDFTRAAELDPFDPAPLRERARAYEDKGDMEKAKRDREAAKRLE
jgi:S1-C subfamily serine protease/regulator of sirC expression with transglutaminase-like and TPR domain